MKQFIKNKTGFTLIELIVTMAVIGILVLLAGPRFIGYTQKAEITRIQNDVKVVESAAEIYHLHHEDWPRLTDTPYTAEELESYAEKIYNITGEVIELDENGNFYNIDWDKMSPYVKKPKDAELYILQNPVGKVFYLNNLTESGKAALDIVKSGESDGEFKLDGLKITKMVSGAHHTLSLMSDGTVVAFGQNNAGQLGLGYVSEMIEEKVDDNYCATQIDPFMCEMELEMNNGVIRYEKQFEPIVVPGLNNIIDIAASGYISMALTAEGTVYTWGQNDNSLNNTFPYNETISTPSLHPELHDVSSIYAFNYAQGAIKNDGTVLRWGHNWTWSVAPNLPTNTIASPTTIPELYGAVYLLEKQALLENGDVIRWNFDIDTTKRLGFTKVPIANGLIIEEGYDYHLVLTKDNKVYGVGSNYFGQLGLGNIGVGTLNKIEVFTEIPDLRGAVEIYTNHSATFAVMNDGRVLAAGNNQDGNLGVGSDNNIVSVFTEVQGIKNPRAFSFDKMKGLTTIVNGDGKIYILGKGSPFPELLMD